MAMRKKKGRVITVDMTGVESGGGRAIPEGNYTLEIDEITEEESGDGNPYLKVVYKVADGPCKGARVWDNVSLLPQSLWRFRTWVECCEIEVPDSTMDVDLDDLVGKTVDVEITEETYEGKKRPRVTGFLGVGGTMESETVEETTEETDEETEVETKTETKSGPKKKSAAAAGKYKVGQVVKFKDEKGKTQSGSITAITVHNGAQTECVVDVKGDEWDLEIKDLIA